MSATARRMALHWCRSIEDAEDVAQEALIRFFSHRLRPRNPPVWMYVVTRRLWSRERSRRSIRAAAEAAFRPERFAIQPDLAILESAAVLDRLCRRDRVLILRVIEGVLSRDIARELGCSVRDVGQMVARARRRARDLRGAP